MDNLEPPTCPHLEDYIISENKEESTSRERRTKEPNGQPQSSGKEPSLKERVDIARSGAPSTGQRRVKPADTERRKSKGKPTQRSNAGRANSKPSQPKPAVKPRQSTAVSETPIPPPPPPLSGTTLPSQTEVVDADHARPKVQRIYTEADFNDCQQEKCPRVGHFHKAEVRRFQMLRSVLSRSLRSGRSAEPLNTL